jgi:hypothetical protein
MLLVNGGAHGLCVESVGFVDFYEENLVFSIDNAQQAGAIPGP